MWCACLWTGVDVDVVVAVSKGRMRGRLKEWMQLRKRRNDEKSQR